MDYVAIRDAAEMRMRALGLGRSELARRAGVDRALVTKLLSGDSWVMQPGSLGKLERSLGWEPGDIERIGKGGSPQVVAGNHDVDLDSLEAEAAEISARLEAHRERLRRFADAVREETS